MKNYLPLHVVKILYFSMAGWALTYGLQKWEYARNRLTKIEKLIIRIITSIKNNAHTKPNRHKTENRLELNALPISILIAVSSGAHHSHNTRQPDRMRNFTRTNLAENTLWNHQPVNDTLLYILQKLTTHTIREFSSSAKQYHLNMYHINCFIPNCYTCHQ